MMQGWSHCTSLSAMDAYNQLVDLELRRDKLALELFDEWEEFHLKCVHYVVAVASKGTLLDWTGMTCQLTLPSGMELVYSN